MKIHLIKTLFLILLLCFIGCEAEETTKINVTTTTKKVYLTRSYSELFEKIIDTENILYVCTFEYQDSNKNFELEHIAYSFKETSNGSLLVQRVVDQRLKSGFSSVKAILAKGFFGLNRRDFSFTRNKHDDVTSIFLNKENQKNVKFSFEKKDKKLLSSSCRKSYE